MKKQTITTPLRRSVILNAAIFGITAIPAFAADQPAFHVIEYLNQLGSPIGLVEGSPGVFFSLGSGDPERAFKITPEGSSTVIASFSGSQSGGGPLVTADDGRFYSTLEYPSKAGGLFSVASLPGSKEVYTVQTNNPFRHRQRSPRRVLPRDQRSQRQRYHFLSVSIR